MIERILVVAALLFCFSAGSGFRIGGSYALNKAGDVAEKTITAFNSAHKGHLMPNAILPRLDVRRKSSVSDDSYDIESGPVLSAKKRAVIDQFVAKMGGKRTIQRILIANNGMAATKAIMSMRQWAYMVLGDEKAVEIVALATRDDLNANAEFIRLADTFVEVPSGSNKNNYANVDLIVDIAVAQKVDAVWPGWGHASENPKLPATLKSKGIQFIGPSAAVMSALGDKISANILAQTAQVPSIPWSGANITSALNAEGVIPQEAFNKACINTAEEAAAMADKIGYPVMIKASEGGGGKGIRMVREPADLKTNFIQVQNEVPGSPIFMMQLCTNARHLEVQIVGDEYGNAVALNGRDCSTQRRFQKIFEEGPPSVAPKEIFKQMERSAQRLTQSIGYVGAGTVEYLYNAATNKYFFLELNPRLQVEHPVTEGLSGVNLPSVQLQVAMGIPLERIPEIREFYGVDVNSKTHIDFMKDDYVYPTKHVIAARITAENPDEGFKPTSGKIERVKFQSTPKVWGYFSVGANGGIHEFADSQFGHLFASGPTREEARKNLVLALKEIDVRGDIRTTVEYLIQLLETKEFKENTIDTSWLDGIIREKTVSVAVDPQLVALSAAVYKAHSTLATQHKDFIETLNKGQTSLQSISNMLSFPIEITYDNVKYIFSAATLGPNYYALKINGQVIPVRIREQPDKSLLCNVAGENMQLFGQTEPLGLRMKINGQTVMIPTVFNPSELRSDVTGKIVRYLQNDMDVVEKDKPYVEVEAMKMIMSLKASESGTIRHNLSPGSIISAGDLIASLQLKDPSKVKQISTFNDRLQNVPPKAAVLSQEEAIDSISLAMDGYEHDYEHAVGTFMHNASLPQIETFVTAQFQKFLANEKLFDGQEETAVVSALAKANKDNLAKIVPNLLAKKQVKKRAGVVLSLLRQLEFLPERFPGYSLTFETMSKDLSSALNGLAALTSSAYGEVTLKTKQIIDSSQMPPFQQRLDALKAELLSSTTDLNTLSKQPNIAVSVDLLVLLMKDADVTVRKAAMEVYIRRIYRAHRIKELAIEDAGADNLSARWTFTLRDTVDGQNTPVRYGYMNMLNDFTNLEAQLPQILKRASSHLKRTSSYNEPINVLHIGFTHNAPDGLSDEDAETKVSIKATKALTPHQNALKEMDVRMVNVLLVNPTALPISIANTQNSNKRVGYFNFLSDSAFQEDVVSRHLRPTMPQLLELNRLNKNHDLTRMPTVGRNTFLYLGKEKTANKKDAEEVLFLRSISLSTDSVTPGGAERNILMALDELERAQLDPRVGDSTSSRLFVNVIPDINMNLDDSVVKFSRIMDGMIAKYATRLLKLRVDEIEVKIRVLDNNAVVPITVPKTGGAKVTTDSSDASHTQSAYVPVRLIASSSTGGWLTREAYREYLDPVSGQTTQYCSLAVKDGKVTSPTAADGKGVCVLDPYPSSTILQKKRAVARKVGSTYATDFLGLAEVALINSWQSYFESAGQTGASPPPNLLSFDELVLNEATGELEKVKRFPGSNKIGMLAWHTTLKTPFYPEGREVVFIANDVTVQSGSFGVKEDQFFYKASEYARVRGLPRIFISCNSGARIGLVDELKPKFKVAFKDENNPAAGFEYLYLTEEDFKALPAGTVDATVLKAANGENRYVLDAIIGQTHGIGVENLRGSGLIAGETSRAYDETFTLSYVTGRSVGIGAYLNRLGQRVIQMQQGPMILTGYSALNKLLGKEVYTSQDQLGGPQIMYPNGVTHEVVSNDREGIQAVIDWLSYTPKTFSSITPPLPNSATLIDSPDRPVDFIPTKTPYDPRHMLGGKLLSDGSYVSGFFDKGSFKEYLGGWGKSVVAGRARLGGINVGVIAVETRVMEQRIPADPGNPESREAIQPQAGQVWYPDSAYKTAQVINDFNRGENLPLIIFANWRGFSGGTRDMYGEILKYGAMIVDSLRNYKHPVFVYIPPAGELRGGAWVVIDPTINPGKMEMFADKQARGGILEPPGICEVKYRSQDQIQTMHRLDSQLIDLDEESNSLSSTLSADGDRTKLQSDIKNREKLLAPVYTQIAHEFADLHDRAGRMKAKGCINEVLEWRNARGFFYWRILKRQKEDALKDSLKAASNGQLNDAQIIEVIAKLVPEESRKSDKHFVQWYDRSAAELEAAVNEVRVKHASSSIEKLLKGMNDKDRTSIMNGLKK